MFGIGRNTIHFLLIYGDFNVNLIQAITVEISINYLTQLQELIMKISTLIPPDTHRYYSYKCFTTIYKVSPSFVYGHLYTLITHDLLILECNHFLRKISISMSNDNRSLCSQKWVAKKELARTIGLCDQNFTKIFKRYTIPYYIDIH